MNPDLIPALMAAGMSAAVAQRVANAITTPVKASQSTNAQFVRQPGTGYQEVAGDKNAFAVYASAANTELSDGANGYVFGPGGGALGVSGVSVFDGDVYCAGTTAVGDLAVDGDASVSGTLASQYIAAGLGLACEGAVEASREGVFLTAPVHVQEDLDVRGQSLLNGPITLNGQLDINGNVLWGNNFRSPLAVNVLTAVNLAGGDVVFTPSTVAVLNDFGQPGGLQLHWAFTPTTKSLLDLIEFDAENCKLALKDGAVNVVTAGEITITAV